MAISTRPRLNRTVDGTGLATVHGDRFRPNDYLIDKSFLQGKLGDLISLMAQSPSIVSGMVVSKGTGDSINITAGSVLMYDNQEPSLTVHDYDGSVVADPLNPGNNPVVVDRFLSPVAFAGVTDLAIPSAVLDNVTVNYVKALLEDAQHLQRGPSKDPGTPYDAIQTEELTITVDDVAPTADEILLATFIGPSLGPYVFAADPESGEREFDFGLKISNGKVYAPVGGLEVHKDGSVLKTSLVFNPTADRTVTFPDQSGTLAMLSDIASSSTDALVQTVNQTAHGFVVGDLIRHNGTDYEKAIANAFFADAFGVVATVAGVDDFTVVLRGNVAGLSGLTPGSVYYLSGSVLGAYTTTKPTYSQPVFIATSATTAFVLGYQLVDGEISDGLIAGGLVDNGVNPPSIQPGRYRVGGKLFSFSSAQTLTFAADNFGNTSSDNDNWYYILLSSIGDIRTHLATGSSIAAGLTVNTITNTGGNTWRYAFSGAPDLSGVAVGDIYYSTGCDSSANDGVFVITAVSDPSDYIEVTNTAGVAQLTAGGTGEALFPPGDISGGGAGVEAVTPAPLLDSTLMGYYSPFLAPDYRILGVYYMKAGAVEHIISYRTGADKNDSQIEMHGDNGEVSGIVRALTFARLWGDGLTVTDDGTNGTMITVNRSGRLYMHFNSRGAFNSAGDSVLGFLYYNGVRYAQEFHNNQAGNSSLNASASFSIAWPVNAGDTFQVEQLVGGSGDLIVKMWNAHLEEY